MRLKSEGAKFFYIIGLIMVSSSVGCMYTTEIGFLVFGVGSILISFIL